MTPRDKATYLAYTLGQAMLHCTEIIMTELKAGDKEEQKLYKEKMKDKIKLHNSVNSMFPNAKTRLNKEDLDKHYEAVMNLIDGLWI